MVGVTRAILARVIRTRPRAHPCTLAGPSARGGVRRGGRTIPRPAAAGILPATRKVKPPERVGPVSSRWPVTDDDFVCARRCSKAPSKFHGSGESREDGPGRSRERCPTHRPSGNRLGPRNVAQAPRIDANDRQGNWAGNQKKGVIQIAQFGPAVASGEGWCQGRHRDPSLVHPDASGDPLGPRISTSGGASSWFSEHQNVGERRRAAASLQRSTWTLASIFLRFFSALQVRVL